MRYVGNEPNNFISFNCDEFGENCEKWRIVGVFNNVPTPDGNQTLVKITTAESIGSYSWDASDSNTNEGKGINQWGESGTYEGADLMRELNTDYLGTTTVGTEGKWYGPNNTKSVNMPSSVIGTDQDFIQTVIWNTGSNPSSINLKYENSNIELYAKDVYDFERGSETSNTCSLIFAEDPYCNDTVTRTATWEGKVALIYYSDYVYAIKSNGSKTKTQCLSENVATWSGCDNSWLYSSYYNGRTVTANTITLTRINNGHYNGALIVGGMSTMLTGFVGSPYPIHPTLYLQPHIHVIGGNGSESNPYKITSGLSI